jgi:hypothetical protein
MNGEMAQIDAPERSLTESFPLWTDICHARETRTRVAWRIHADTWPAGIGSIMVEDPAISPPVDVILCREERGGHVAIGSRSRDWSSASH